MLAAIRVAEFSRITCTTDVNMGSGPETNRRDFLTGRSALRAVEGLADRDADPDPQPALKAARRPPSCLLQISRRAMATDFQVYLNVQKYPKGPEAAMKALDLVETLEDQMTVYREHSEVMEINRRASRQAVLVEAGLFELLELALQLHHDSGGAFDITSGPLSKVWGFYRRQGDVPDDQVLQQALSRVGSQWIELDRQAQAIRFQHSGLEINLNSIGKGYALDRCGQSLREAGVDSFLIHGGQSSVLAAGSRPGDDQTRAGWSIALRHPLKTSRRLGELRLVDRAVGTSGSGSQFFHHQGHRYGHVLDPRTGWPTEGVLSATVLAPTAAEADALATAFFVMGLEQATDYCSRHPELSAVMVCPGQRRGSIAVHAIAMADDVWTPADSAAARE
jgi:FAD:protein FMN transferase